MKATSQVSQGPSVNPGILQPIQQVAHGQPLVELHVQTHSAELGGSRVASEKVRRTIYGGRKGLLLTFHVLGPDEIIHGVVVVVSTELDILCVRFIICYTNHHHLLRESWSSSLVVCIRCGTPSRRHQVRFIHHIIHFSLPESYYWKLCLLRYPVWECIHDLGSYTTQIHQLICQKYPIQTSAGITIDTRGDLSSLIGQTGIHSIKWGRISAYRTRHEPHPRHLISSVEGEASLPCS